MNLHKKVEQFLKISQDSKKYLEERRRSNRERQRKFQEKLKNRPLEIEKQLNNPTLDESERKKLEEELNKIKSQTITHVKNRVIQDELIREKRRNFSLDDLIFQMMASVANVKMGIKKNITTKLKMEENTLFKPLKDQINNAINNKDDITVNNLVKKLQKLVNEYAESDENIVKYKENSQIYFSLKQLLLQTNLDSVQSIKNSIEECNNILLQKNKVFNSPNKILVNIVHLLEDKLNLLSKEKMSNNRIETLKKIANEHKLTKKAQEAIDVAKNDTNNADDDFAHKVFMALLDNLEIEGLD